MDNQTIAKAMTIRLDSLFDDQPALPSFDPGIRRAPKRGFTLSREETALALKNALRYIPEKWQAELAPEFLEIHMRNLD